MPRQARKKAKSGIHRQRFRCGCAAGQDLRPVAAERLRPGLHHRHDLVHAAV